MVEHQRSYTPPKRVSLNDPKLNFCHESGDGKAKLCIRCLSVLDYSYSFWWQCRGCRRWWARF